MTRIEDEFARFEHEGWQRVADKYDSVWSSLTRQFIPYLIDAAQIAPAMSVLDVACGPGYVSAAARQLGAIPTGVDFSSEMVAIANRILPEIDFIEGDAQKLPFAGASFDRVLMNFGLLHLSRHEKACSEAFRVLRAGGKFGFTIWADRLDAIMRAIEDGVRHYAKGDRFIIPMAAHVIVVSKNL